MAAAPSPSFVVRVRTPSGMKRFGFGSERDRFDALQAAVAQEFGIAAETQLLSLAPLANPDVSVDETCSLSDFLLESRHAFFSQLFFKNADFFFFQFFVNVGHKTFRELGIKCGVVLIHVACVKIFRFSVFFFLLLAFIWFEWSEYFRVFFFRFFPFPQTRRHPAHCHRRSRCARRIACRCR